MLLEEPAAMGARVPPDLRVVAFDANELPRLWGRLPDRDEFPPRRPVMSAVASKRDSEELMTLSALKPVVKAIDGEIEEDRNKDAGLPTTGPTFRAPSPAGNLPMSTQEKMLHIGSP